MSLHDAVRKLVEVAAGRDRMTEAQADEIQADLGGGKDAPAEAEPEAKPSGKAK